MIFQANNNHSEGCGNPPNIIAADPGKYYGYFQNEHGEQWIFVYDYDKEQATLRGGDVDWEKEATFDSLKDVPYILGTPEQAWLAGCFAAATAFKKIREDKRTVKS